MTLVFPRDWSGRLKTWLNSSADFTSGSHWFDGAVLLEIGDEIVWLKIYGGQVIDVQKQPSPLGFTFSLKAREEAWRAFLRADRNEILSFTGSRRIVVEGNQLEFMRLTKMIVALAEGLRAVLRETEARGG
jgi:hypothetical protein